VSPSHAFPPKRVPGNRNLSLLFSAQLLEMVDASQLASPSSSPVASALVWKRPFYPKGRYPHPCRCAGGA
jgi:hypothetical protein